MNEDTPVTSRIVFLGAGNMAEALISGLLRHQTARPDQLRVTDIAPQRCAHFQAAYGVSSESTNSEAVRNAQLVVLAVKPQGVPALLAEIREAVTAEHLLISIAAGIPSTTIEAALGGGRRVVRSMPNTPALIGQGMTALCAGSCATDADMDVAERLLRSAGRVVRVREEQMDGVTAVSGSGPAYLFYLMEAMQTAAEELGLDGRLAHELVSATLAGAAALALDADQSPAELRRRVTSKGGTTAAALAVLDENDVAAHWGAAIRAAHQRSRELSAATAVNHAG